MDELEAIVPATCFPRYQYMLKIRKDLAGRYNCLTKAHKIEDCKPLTEDDGKICILMYKSVKSKDQFLDMKEIVPRYSDDIDINIYKTESFRRGSELRRNTFFIFFKDILTSWTNCKEFPERTILIGNDITKEILSGLLRDEENVAVCLAERVGSMISTHLERHALSGMRIACDNLYSILNGKNTKDISTIGGQSRKGENADSTNQRSKSAGAGIDDDSKDQTCRPQSVKIKQTSYVKEEQCQEASQKLSEKVKQAPNFEEKQGKIESGEYQSPLNIQHMDIEMIDRLYNEIVGLFNRSILPKDEKPRHSEGLYKIDKTILQDLLMLGNSIRSCGYRYSTLQINVNDEEISDDLKKGIKDIMVKHNITNYSVVPSGIKEYSTCHVGQGVKVENEERQFHYATLGGFAKTSSDESKRDWAIISRHFARTSMDRKLYIAKEGKICVGEIMKEVKDGEANKQYIDIAAASLEPSIPFDDRYVTEENKSAKGTLCPYDAEKLLSLKVHIKGATTKLGLGIITIPGQKAVQNNIVDENLIIVEDREKGIAFCQEGDSGAIVCAANPDKYGEEVYLISMIIGENINNKSNTTSYATVRLDKGLEQLKSLTDKDFQMY